MRDVFVTTHSLSCDTSLSLVNSLFSFHNISLLLTCVCQLKGQISTLEARVKEEGGKRSDAERSLSAVRVQLETVRL